MLQERETTAQAAEWRDEHFPAGGDSLHKRLPTNAMPTVAQLGMIVLPAGGGGYAVIVDMTQETCTVRFEDGALDVLQWGEVSLDHVQPPATARRLGGSMPELSAKGGPQCSTS